MAKRRRTAVVAGSLLAGACGPPAPPRPEPAAVARDPRAAAVAALARDALYHREHGRRTLYTWTTEEQVQELRRARRLLVREESPEHGASYLEQVIHALAERGDPLAALLDSTGYAKMRFAWHAPWATRAGWPGEHYGDRLIRVTLRAQAIVLSISTASGLVEAHDLAGRSIAAADALAAPDRIAAIYFVSDPAAVLPGLPPAATTYREVALCNEAMIESWATGTPEIARELEANAAALEALARYLRTREPWTEPAPPQVRHAWIEPVPDGGPEHAFRAALAFDNRNYRLDPDALEALAKLLRATPMTPAVSGGGDALFAGVGVPRPAPRVVPPKKRRVPASATYGTYMRTIPSGPHKRP